MIPTLTLEGFPAANGRHTFDWRGANTLSGASGTGKTTTIHALLALFGAADLPPGKLSVDAVTGGGTTLRIAQTKSSTSYERHTPAKGTKPAVDVDSKAWRDFAPWTIPAQDPDLVRAIALPGEWHRLATSTVLAVGLRDLLTRVLPPADVPKRVVKIVTAAGLEPDPNLVTMDVKSLLVAQTSANSAKDKAEALATEATKRLTDLRANPAAPVDEEAIRAAQTIVSTAGAWVAHDLAMKLHSEALARIAAQKAARDNHAARVKDLGKCPEVDASELQAKRIALDNARAALRAAEEAERNAAETARIEAARKEAAAAAERKAAAESAAAIAEAEERGRREAEATRRAEDQRATNVDVREAASTPPPVAPPPVVPVKRPGPKPAPAPAPALFVAAEPDPNRRGAINILFAPVAGTPDLVFVEVEDAAGQSIKVGRWIKSAEFDVLAIDTLPTTVAGDSPDDCPF